MRSDKLSVVDRHRARYVLVHISHHNDQGVGGFGAHRIGKDVVMGIAVPCEDVWLYYTSTKLDARLQPPSVRRALSAMYSVVDGYDFSEGTGTRYLRREFQVVKGMMTHTVEVVGPVKGEFEPAKVTAEHHTHYRPEEVWEVAQSFGIKKRCLAVVLKNLRRISGVTEATVATCLMYALFARPQVAYIFASSARLWDSKDAGELGKRLKELSTPLKSMHNQEILDMTEMFEMASLLNRGVGGIDWKAEKEHRTRPNVIEVSKADVYKEAKKVFSEGISHGYKYSKLDLEKYMDSRWEWVPSGSVHSQYEEDKVYIKKEYRHRTKFVTLNKMPKQHIAKMLSRRPEIKAWASVKYEWAKMRAIYGVDLTSTVITNFAMYRCEEVFRHRFPIGEEAAADRVHRRLKYLLKDAESLCYDFDDFNAQHSISSMQAVLEAYFDTFYDDMSVEQRAAMQWVCRSVEDMTIINNEGEVSEKFKIAGTLLSGWRLTTFINTALNYIYFKIAGVFDIDGVRDSVHNGDDVLVAIDSVKTANLVHERMRSINARAQPSKCNVFSVGEFLRVEHKIDKEEGLGAQYLTRGVATLVHSRIESQEPTRLVEAVKAAVTRCMEVAQRSKGGDDVAMALLDMVIKRLSGIFGVDIDTCRKLVQAHAIVGGPIKGVEGKIEYEFEERVEYEDERSMPQDMREARASVNELGPGINDYCKVLTRQYGQYVPKEKILFSIMSATRRQLAITRKTWLVMTDVRANDRYKYGRALFRMYRGLVDIPFIEKARFVGISPISMISDSSARLIKRLISNAVDVDYTLRVLL
nr:RNA-dependent RNA polymerase [Peach-associated virus 2]